MPTKMFRKKLIVGIILTLIIIGGYFGYRKLTKNNNTAQYVTAMVEKGTLIVSVSGSGQISASNQVDIKPKVSGDIVYIGIKNGQEVKASALIAQIDNSSVQRAVQDAEISLEAAKIRLEELLEPPDELKLLQAENSLAKAKTAKQNAENNITKGYEDAFNAVTDVFFDLPTIVTGLNDILYSYGIADSEKNLSGNWQNIAALSNTINIYNDKEQLEKFIKSAEDDYLKAKNKYDKNFQNYRDASRYSESEIIESLLEETLGTLRATAETIKREVNMLDFWINYRSAYDLRVFSKVTGYQSDLKTYTSKTNSQLSSLLKIQRSFEDNRQAVVDAEYLIKEKELSLAELKAGSDDIDIRSQKNTIQQKEAALAAARENLANCYIRAPFDGIIAEVNSKIKKGDAVSSGTVLASIITQQKIAGITLNEIDAAKVKVGQKATLTFDAVEDLTITGEVIEVDTIGTVSQGVVTYNAKITFDTQDERIKPGMSLSAAIIADVKQNILIVPNSAVKYQGDTKYVELLTDEGISHSQNIEIGTSNDIYTEIISGLNEGDKVITQTISPGKSSSSSNSEKSSSGKGFAPGGGGEFMRIMR